MDKRRLLWLFNKGSGLVYLLRDEFTTDDAAPITSPRTCEPGPGTLTSNDSSAYISSGNYFPITNQTAPSIYSGLFANTAGLGMFTRLSLLSTGFGCGLRSSLSNQDTDRDYPSIRFDSGSILTRYINDSITVDTYSVTFPNPFTIGIVNTSLTSSVCINGSKILFIYRDVSSANRRLALFRSTPSVSFDWVRVGILSGDEWTTEFRLATNRVASPAVNETTTSEANALIEMTWTAVTGETWEMMVRRTDDNNCWIVRGDQAGSTIKLIEKNAGVETERSSAAQTWTNTTAYRLVVIQDGNTIRTYIANVAKNSYTSASFNNTATGVKTNKAGSNLVTYPRTLSGAALTELQRWTS